ncbi:MAG: hypothetical protein Q8K45_00650 [Rubrivivax sp.]|nr:hypothetical protein [Rubrivivax sp.]
MAGPPAEATPPGALCCDSERACVFAKALLARTAVCERAERRAVAERVLVECASPVARTNCGTLAALLHERARFALRLPPARRPLIHMQALRLQCGGLQALQQVLGSSEPDVHRMVGLAQEGHGSLTELPWEALVARLVAWQAPRRGRGRTGGEPEA